MSIVRAATLVEHAFDVTGMDTELPNAHNPANGMFIPATVRVVFHDGAFGRVDVGGPLRKGTKLLKTFGWASWDSDYLDPDDDFYIPQGQGMPRWLKALVHDVMMHPFAGPGDKTADLRR